MSSTKEDGEIEDEDERPLKRLKVGLLELAKTVDRQKEQIKTLEAELATESARELFRRAELARLEAAYKRVNKRCSYLNRESRDMKRILKRLKQDLGLLLESL